MTANAIYGYFATRDDLVTTLIKRRGAPPWPTPWTPRGQPPRHRTQPPGSEPGPRLPQLVTRQPTGLRLIFGDPFPAITRPKAAPPPRPPAGSAPGHSARRGRLAARRTPLRRQRIRVVRFRRRLLDDVRPAFPELPPAAVALALRIRGHCTAWCRWRSTATWQTQTHNPDKLFHEELTQLVRALASTHLSPDSECEPSNV